MLPKSQMSIYVLCCQLLTDLSYIYKYVYIYSQNYDNTTMHYYMHFYYMITCNLLHVFSLHVSHVYNVS